MGILCKWTTSVFLWQASAVDKLLSGVRHYYEKLYYHEYPVSVSATNMFRVTTHVNWLTYFFRRSILKEEILAYRSARQ